MLETNSAKHDNDNKLFCTFLEPIQLEPAISRLLTVYKGTKLYILLIPAEEKFAVTYSLPQVNTLLSLESRTINVHRKKTFNVLYTINALNEAVKLQNSGIYVPHYELDWSQ